MDEPVRPWLTVIGIGDRRARQPVVGGAGRAVMPPRRSVGGARHLAMLTGFFGADDPLGVASEGGDRRAPRASSGDPTAVLATGDPMWFGIGATLSSMLDPGEMRVLPSPSAFSLAAARLGWPLQDCDCLTVHGRPLETLNRVLAPGRASSSIPKTATVRGRSRGF